MYALKQAFSGIKRAGYMSVACVIISTFSFLILGIFLLATANLREVLKFAHDKVEIVAFLEGGISQAKIDSLRTEIRAIPFIDKIRYVSPDDALRRLKSEFGQRSYILEALDENPLPSSFEITLKPQYRLKQRVIGVAERISKLKGVEDVSFGRGWITRLEKLVRILATIDVGVGLAVGIATIVTVAYTVRLTLYARKDFIRVLKLVGATDMFVMTPFLIEGVIHGLVCIALATGILYGAYRFIEVRVPQVVFMTGGMIGVFAVFGIFVSVLGSYLSVRAFLREKD